MTPRALDVLPHHRLRAVAVAAPRSPREAPRARRRRPPATSGCVPTAREEPAADVGDPEAVDDPRELPRSASPRRAPRGTPGSRRARLAAVRAARSSSIARRSAARSSSVASRGREAGDLRARAGAAPRAARGRPRGRRSATKKPRFTSNSTSPSPASRRSASRTEPREMPSASASSAWPIRAPGASRPSTIIAPQLVVGETDDRPHPERARSGAHVRARSKVDIRCSNLYTTPSSPAQGAPDCVRRRNRMSQTQTRRRAPDTRGARTSRRSTPSPSRSRSGRCSRRRCSSA